VVPIYVPPLRERKEEIPPLALKFLQKFNDQYNLQKKLDEKLIDKLINYEWPGNIRELRNVIERAMVTSSDTVIRSIKLGSGINQGEKEISIEKESPPTIDLRKKVDAYERELIEHYIKIYKTSRKLAKALGVSQTTVIRKAAQYGIKFENH
jgi:TyrR family helix-turn-helix protein